MNPGVDQMAAAGGVNGGATHGPADGSKVSSSGSGTQGSTSASNSSKSIKDIKRKQGPLACLSCRKRHLKCDGTTPTCGPCVSTKRECVYIPSRRGGVRIRKNTTAIGQVQPFQADTKQTAPPTPKDPQHIASQYPPAQFHQPSQPVAPLHLAQQPPPQQELVAQPPQNHIPAASNGASSAFGTHDSTYSQSDYAQPPPPPPPQYFYPGHNQVQYNMPIHPQPQQHLPRPGLPQASQPAAGLPLTTHYTSPGNFSSGSYSSFSFTNSPSAATTNSDSSLTPVTDLVNGVSPSSSMFGSEADSYIVAYYELMQSRHPVFVEKELMYNYLGSIDSWSDLFETLKLVKMVLQPSVSASSGEATVDNAAITEQLGKISQMLVDQQDDIVTLQCCFLGALVGHLSMNYPISMGLRSRAVQICERMAQTPNYLDILISPRTERLRGSLLLRDSAFKAYQEVFFIDVMMSAASHCQVSRLDGKLFAQNIPERPGFSFKSKYEAIGLGRDVCVMASNTQSSAAAKSILQSKITTWQGQLMEGYNHKTMVNSIGQVDEGIVMAAMAINYSSILLNVPGSALSKASRNTLPSFPNCFEENMNTKEIPANGSRPGGSHYAIMNTRLCISAANNIASIVTETGYSKLQARTPLYTCALAMGLLVHIKAYYWLSQSINNSMDVDPQQLKEEMETIKEYIRLEDVCLLTLSKTWAIAKKLRASLRHLIYQSLLDPVSILGPIDGPVKPPPQQDDLMDLYDIQLDSLEALLMMDIPLESEGLI